MASFDYSSNCFAFRDLSDFGFDARHLISPLRLRGVNFWPEFFFFSDNRFYVHVAEWHLLYVFYVFFRNQRMICCCSGCCWIELLLKYQQCQLISVNVRNFSSYAECCRLVCVFPVLLTFPNWCRVADVTGCRWLCLLRPSRLLTLNLLTIIIQWVT